MNGPAYLYEPWAGDRAANPATDADLDPKCERVDCPRMLTAASGDTRCAAGHVQELALLPELPTVEGIRAKARGTLEIPEPKEAALV